MAKPCSEAFVRVADELGGISCDANPIIDFRAPWSLENWTLPVVELLLISGAVYALVHAVVMLRRGRPEWFGLWMATIVYVVTLEPPLYFPENFGLEDITGLIFVHNTFSVEFLYDRLPLYIVALYPAGIYLSHALVDALGVFRRHGIIVGALTAAAVHHLFYEIFDQLGPQLRWWAWNPGAETNSPFFGSVPLSSATVFATISPIFLIGFARLLLFRDTEGRTRRSWTLRTVGVGLGTVVCQPLGGLPTNLVGSLDGSDTLADQLIMWAVIGVVFGVAGWAALTSTPYANPDRRFGSVLLDKYETVFGVAFLATFAFLWLTALPDLLDAVDGRTADGAPTGNPLYALLCGVLAVALITRANGLWGPQGSSDQPSSEAPSTEVSA